MADAGARRHDLEIAERGLAPFQELVALHVAAIFERDILLEALRRAEGVDHHRVIDDEVDGDERIDLLRIAAELGHRIAHRGEIDDGGDAGEILHQHAGRAILDLALGLALLLPVDQRLDVLAGDGDAVLEAEQIFEQHLHREGQAADIAQFLARLGQRIISVGFAAHLERVADAKCVMANGGHLRAPLRCAVSRSGLASAGRRGKRKSARVSRLPREGRGGDGRAMRLALPLILLALAVPAAAQREALGVFGGWGAFRDAGRCYAIAAPVEALPAQGWRPFLSVGHWPGRGGGQLFVRLSREKRRRLGGAAAHRRARLSACGRGRDAWASDIAPTTRSWRRCAPASRRQSRRAAKRRLDPRPLPAARRGDRDRRRRLGLPAAPMSVAAASSPAMARPCSTPRAGCRARPSTRRSPAPASPRRRRSGEALLVDLGPAPPLALWASPTGRALQTLAVAAEHLRARLARRAHRRAALGNGDGGWSGRYYRRDRARRMATSSIARAGPVHLPSARRRMV